MLLGAKQSVREWEYEQKILRFRRNPFEGKSSGRRSAFLSGLWQAFIKNLIN